MVKGESVSRERSRRKGESAGDAYSRRGSESKSSWNIRRRGTRIVD